MGTKVEHLLNRDGRYYARIVIPKALRSYLDGKTELRTPLGADRRVAKANLPAALATMQVQIGIARERASKAQRRDIRVGHYPMAMPAMVWQDYLERTRLDAEIRAQDHRYAEMEVDADQARRYRDGFAGKLSDAELGELVGDRIERLRLRGSFDAVIGSPEWRTLAQGLCASAYEAMAREAERNEGDFTGKPSHPVVAAGVAQEDTPDPVSLTGLFNDYIRELKRGGKGAVAEKRWVPVFDHLRKFLKHNDASRITKKDLIAWRDKLLETLSPRTVRDVHLTGLRAVLNWAAQNERIPANPANGVKVKVTKAVQSREKGFRDDEALAIVKATLTYVKPEKESAEIAAAKKWAPILCAFTGARITEVTQLRKEDIRDEGGVPVMRITPDAGSVKTGQYRDVPLHPQLVELGFLDFVKAASPGPLFHKSKGEKAIIGARTASGRVSNWLQAIGVVPEGVSPNHGWRHRFKTLANELGLSDRVADAIQGHAGRTAGDSYGDVTIKARKVAIDKLPRFALT
ncbi:MAG: integrase [Mesorhizobium sp.]|nr:integrase [Mesorhizobium sp.]